MDDLHAYICVHTRKCTPSPLLSLSHVLTCTQSHTNIDTWQAKARTEAQAAFARVAATANKGEDDEE